MLIIKFFPARRNSLLLFQCRRQNGFIIGGADRRLFQIDIRAIEAIDFHQTNNLVFQLIFVAGFQLDMRVCAAEEISTARPGCSARPRRRNSASDRL